MHHGLIKYFDTPDEIREFPKGRFEIVRIRGITIGRATYQPGWKWSEHVGPASASHRCEVEHLGLVISGQAMVEYSDGTTMRLQAGSLFYIPPVPHDSWVVGNEVYVSLHLQGADHYAE